MCVHNINPILDGGGLIVPALYKQAPAVSVLIFVTQNLMPFFSLAFFIDIYAKKIHFFIKTEFYE